MIQNMELPQRKTAELRRGRISIPGAMYFVTLCSQQRTPVLTMTSHPSEILKALHGLHTNTDIDLWAATIMPDHVHLLFILGSQLTFAQTIAKFKSLSRNLGRTSWRWQENVFEHRLRLHDSAEDYGFYIYMNPYCANLLDTTSVWPWWTAPNGHRLGFLTKLDAGGTPPHEWLQHANDISSQLTTGE